LVFTYGNHSSARSQFDHEIFFRELAEVGARMVHLHERIAIVETLRRSVDYFHDLECLAGCPVGDPLRSPCSVASSPRWISHSKPPGRLIARTPRPKHTEMATLCAGDTPTRP